MGIINFKQLKRFVHNLQYNPNVNDKTDVIIVSEDEPNKGLGVNFLATSELGDFENYDPEDHELAEEVIIIGIKKWPERYTIKIN